MWVPHYGDQTQPVYLMIANALEQDIEGGRLAEGDRLPTLKDLAEAPNVTPGTVGRAYDEAAKRGLVAGEVGRGTFVRQLRQPLTAPSVPAPVAGFTTHALSPEALLQVYRDLERAEPPPCMLLAIRAQRFELGEAPGERALADLALALAWAMEWARLPEEIPA